MQKLDDTQGQTGSVADSHRLAVLRSFDEALESDNAPFDEIARMAATVTGRGTAIVSLVERNRQKFLGRHGLSMVETPIEQSICRHIMDLDGVTVIEDTRADPRTRENPLCKGNEGFRFYAGVPLISDGGEPLGALAVLDKAPGALSSFQAELLQMLSRQAIAQLHLHRALKRSEMMRREVDHRVKNSLQSVAAMTRIQARAVTSDEAREALENVSRRINTVAALNQQMYSTGSDSAVALEPYLGSIFDLVRDGLPDRIDLVSEVDDVTLDSRKAGAIAVIVNEFVTNSAKHAFGDGPGTVRVSLKSLGADQIVLTCADDGAGMGPDLPTDRLGLAIIDSAIDQLNGVKTRLDGPGHGIRITIRP